MNAERINLTEKPARSKSSARRCWRRRRSRPSRQRRQPALRARSPCRPSASMPSRTPENARSIANGRSTRRKSRQRKQLLFQDRTGRACPRARDCPQSEHRRGGIASREAVEKARIEQDRQVALERIASQKTTEESEIQRTAAVERGADRCPGSHRGPAHRAGGEGRAATH